MKTAFFAALLVLPLLAPGAQAACCQSQQYYNWGRVQQQNQVARQRAWQQQLRLCRSIASSGRRVMWTGC